MKLAAVRGVVQNTTQKNMVSTIVGSLNQIMEVLILVAVLLAVVILYDLTNLNVSERIRELSTIKVLGFHTSETRCTSTAKRSCCHCWAYSPDTLRRMAAPIHHHRSATRRSHVRPRHQLDRIGGPGHRRGVY